MEIFNKKPKYVVIRFSNFKYEVIKACLSLREAKKCAIDNSIVSEGEVPVEEEISTTNTNEILKYHTDKTLITISKVVDSYIPSTIVINEEEDNYIRRLLERYE